MAIEWEDVDVTPDDIAVERMRGIGGSGQKYDVWLGTAFLDGDPTLCWIAYGWPEPNTDTLPTFSNNEDAMELCEKWESILLDAEQKGRDAFRGTRSGPG